MLMFCKITNDATVAEYPVIHMTIRHNYCQAKITARPSGPAICLSAPGRAHQNGCAIQISGSREAGRAARGARTTGLISVNSAGAGEFPWRRKFLRFVGIRKQSYLCGLGVPIFPAAMLA
jgi:hypothetical protein